MRLARLLLILTSWAAWGQQPVVTFVYGGLSNIVSPGKQVNIGGMNLSDKTNTNRVFVNGIQALLNIPVNTPTGIQVRIPPQTPVGFANIVVSNAGLSSAPFPVTVQKYVANLGGHFDDDGRVIVFANHLDSTFVTSSKPAMPGERIQVYFAGYSPGDHPDLTLSIGGYPTQIESVADLTAYPIPGVFFATLAVPPYLTSGPQPLIVVNTTPVWCFPRYPGIGGTACLRLRSSKTYKPG